MDEPPGDDGGFTTVMERAKNSVRSTDRIPKIKPTTTFDPNHPQIKEDIIKMIAQYLEAEHYIAAAAVVQDEANVKRNDQQTLSAHLRRVRKGIRDGDWDAVSAPWFCDKIYICRYLSSRYFQVIRSVKKYLKSTHSHKSFLYAIHKQEYLELIDKQVRYSLFSVVACFLYVCQPTGIRKGVHLPVHTIKAYGSTEPCFQ